MLFELIDSSKDLQCPSVIFDSTHVTLKVVYNRSGALASLLRLFLVTKCRGQFRLFVNDNTFSVLNFQIYYNIEQ